MRRQIKTRIGRRKWQQTEARRKTVTWGKTAGVRCKHEARVIKAKGGS